jgi:hypothetical protein
LLSIHPHNLVYVRVVCQAKRPCLWNCLGE